MALITCPDCVKKISDQAPACPYCGRPTDIKTIKKNNNVRTVKKSNISKVLAVLIILVSVVGMIASAVSNGGGAFWPLVFLGGIAWFIAIRILRD